MTSLVDRIRTAGDFINAARQEETPTGNPITAARHYISAVEIIARTADDIPISNPDARRFLFYQLRQRVEQYYERAELLLGAAEEANFFDKPTNEGGLSAALAQLGRSSPPAASCGVVMGIPAEECAMLGSSGSLPAQYCFSEPPAPLGPPPPSPRAAASGVTDELEKLFKSCSFGDPEK